MAKRQDTKCESEGAEFYILGLLMINGVWSYKTYTNMAGYDIMCVNPINQKNARVQVKSRWATDSNKSFPIKNLDCDFVVYINLNRGYWYNKNKRGDISGIKVPDIFVFPINLIKEIRDDNSDWKKVNTKKIEDLEYYRENWSIIKDFLGAPGGI